MQLPTYVRVILVALQAISMGMMLISLLWLDLPDILGVKQVLTLASSEHCFLL